MIRKFKICALALTLCLGMTVFASCGGNKDTTHDANTNGQVVTEEKNDNTENNSSANKNESNNENGIVGEVVTGAARGVRDIVDGVADGARDMMGGNNDSSTPQVNSHSGEMNSTRTMPRTGK